MTRDVNEFLDKLNTPVKDPLEDVKIQVFKEDQELEPEAVGMFLDKSIFEERPELKVTPTGLNKGRFGYNLKFFIEGGDGNEYQVDCNKSNYNWLIQNLGNKISMWKDKKIFLHGERKSFMMKKKGQEDELVEGWQLTFRKA